MSTPVQPTDAASASAEEVTIDSKPRLTLGSRLSYGLGDLACVLVFTGMSGFLALFYTDAVGIPAAVAGLIILIARVADGVFDPIVGAISERTRSRWGRFRPWIFFGAVPLGVFAVLTFTAPFPGDSFGAVIWAAITYGLCGFIYSCVNLPYAALSGVMAETPADRLSMNSMRFAFGSIGLVACGVITLPLVGAFGSASTQGLSITGFTVTAAIFAVIGVILFFVTFAASRENVVPVRQERPSIKSTARAVLTNGPLLVVAILTILSGVAFYSRLGVIVYYYIYNSSAGALVALLIPLSPIAALVGSLIFSRFATSVGKRTLFVMGLAVQAAALLTLFFVDPTNLTVVMVLTVVHGLAGFSIPLTYSMVADAADYGEHKTGVRADGVAFAVVSVAQKLAFALAGVSVALLGAFGYQPNTTQTPETLQGINIIVNLLPALIAIAAIAVAFTYRLTDTRAASIRNELSAASVAASGNSEKQ